MHPLDFKYTRQQRKWLDPRRALLLSSKTNARNQGIEHSLTLEDIVIPEICPITGAKLKPQGRDPNSMTLDKVDPTKGYIKSNVRVISWRANKLKSNGTLEEFEKIIEYMKNT